MKNSRVYANVDLDAVLYNLESMHQNMKKDAKIAAVIKTDGYGHGAPEIAQATEHLPYLWGFAVATVDEAMVIKRRNVSKPILILGITFEEQYPELIENGIRAAVCEYEAACRLSALAVSMDRICHIHIVIDSGMGRIGFPVSSKTADIVEQISALPNMDIEGIFTHFARADEAEKEPTYRQIEDFQKMISMLNERGISIPLKHCSNSAGIVELPEANFSMCRAGITLYGLWPSEEVVHKIPLKPVMSIYSRIAFLKELEAGKSISYGGTYTTTKRQRIATIPVGYGDGYCRGLSNRGEVLICGKRAPICGRICMDQFMVDVTDIPEAKEGSLVTLIGSDKTETITFEELGSRSGRFHYESACLITNRVPRIYYKDGEIISIRPACME